MFESKEEVLDYIERKGYLIVGKKEFKEDNFGYFSVF